MGLANGTRLGPYEIVAPLGAGGMGEVYTARDTRLGRTVAIKILPAEFAADAKLKIRFEREAKAISALSHPHICALYDVGPDYLVMEHCEGKTLAKRLASGPLPIEQVIEYGIQIADALDKAHRAGIIHRDLKPANIMLTKSGVKLLDFGLAKQHTDSSPEESTVQHVPLNAGLPVAISYREIHVRPFPGREPRVTVSTDGGSMPFWSRNARELFYSRGNELWSVPVSADGTFKAGTPRRLFKADWLSTHPWGNVLRPSPDGTKFLTVRPVPEELPEHRIIYAPNWIAELKQSH